MAHCHGTDQDTNRFCATYLNLFPDVPQAWYCSAGCQSTHWSKRGHKVQCKQLQADAARLRKATAAAHDTPPAININAAGSTPTAKEEPTAVGLLFPRAVAAGKNAEPDFPGYPTELVVNVYSAETRPKFDPLSKKDMKKIAKKEARLLFSGTSQAIWRRGSKNSSIVSRAKFEQHFQALSSGKQSRRRVPPETLAAWLAELDRLPACGCRWAPARVLKDALQLLTGIRNGNIGGSHFWPELLTALGMFRDFDAELWANTLVAGGAILASCLPLPVDFAKLKPPPPRRYLDFNFSSSSIGSAADEYTPKRSVKQYIEQSRWPDGDIDIFLYGLSEAEAERKMVAVFKQFRQSLLLNEGITTDVVSLILDGSSLLLSVEQPYLCTS